MAGRIIKDRIEGSHPILSPSRLETFSDGVFAIAATLLILDVRASVTNVSSSVVHIWPNYLAYAASFITMGIIWINHHVLLTQIKRVDRLFLLINIVFLMFVAFIPFPTGLIAAHLRDHGLEAAALVYGITMTATSSMINVLWFYATTKNRLLRDDFDKQMVSGISRSYVPGPIVYLVATLMALVSPYVSVVLYAIVITFYVVDSSIFGRTV